METRDTPSTPCAEQTADQALLDALRSMVRDELSRIEARQSAMVADLAALRLHAEGKPRRDELLREIARALGLGVTWAAAQNVALILAGIQPAPAGAEGAVAALARTRLSGRQVLRILQAGVDAEAADKSAALCQLWPLRDDGVSITDEDKHE